MSLDQPTIDRLRYQSERRAKLLAQTPPDRKEAALCMERVDSILDRRPRPIAVATDGEVVLDDQSPWVAEQVAYNASLEPERVLTAEQHAELGGEG